MKHIKAKSSRYEIRLSDKDKELIERTAIRCGFKEVSKFILAVLIPYCCKIESKFNESDKNKVD